ncbi:hypothetical protein BFJ70_g16126 [Fusarium oxysporum]|nr:hypothetical protein BFJ70_g16126 [Fusarium oxysporum]
METSNNARYQCSSCGRPFDRKDALSRHMRLHDPDRAAAKVRRKSCTSCFGSKIKCSGTRPVCSSCEKRGIDCRYLRVSESQAGSNTVNRTSQAQSNTQTQQADSDEHRRSDPVEETTLASLVGVRSPRLQSLGQSTALGSSTPYRGQFSYIDDAHDLGTANNADWLGEGPISDSAFAGPFIPGLWDFFPMSPPQAPQPVLPLPQHSETQEDASEDYSRDLESNTVSDFEHPWPMEWNPGSSQPWSLPLLEDPQHYKPIARTFCNNPITASGITTLKARINLYYDYGPWQQIQLENFPSGDSLNHAIDMYFVHFHAVLPMVHHPTFDPQNDLLVTLCLITIGVKYTGFSGAQNFSKALFELTRRLILSRAERERRFVRTETYLTAQLLQAVFGYLGDDERTFEIAESCRSSLVYNAKCMGLFRQGSGAPEFEQNDLSPDASWHAWIRTERYRRLAWSIYELDTSSAYLHNNRPLLSPEDINIPLPSSSQHWEAQSAHAWASLHPWASSCPPTGSLRDVIHNVVHGTETGFSKLQDEKHRFLVVLSLARTIWSLKEVHFSSIIERPNNGFESALCTQQQELLLATIDKLYRSDGLRSRPYTRSQQQQVVYRAQLTHITHLIGAGDLMTFLYSYLRRGHESVDAEFRMRKWAERDAQRVRRVAYHSAQLLGLMRTYPSNLPSEPFVVFHAGVILSVMSILLPACPASVETLPLQIDHLHGDEQQDEKAQAWIKHGGNFSIWVHGVTSLIGEQGREQILDQTAWLLGGMNVWPIAKKFAVLIISLREGLARE